MPSYEIGMDARPGQLDACGALLIKGQAKP
jgi:hypothetical protein